MIEAKIVDPDTLAPESSEAKVMGITQNVLDRICEEKLTRRDAYAMVTRSCATPINISGSSISLAVFAIMFIATRDA